MTYESRFSRLFPDIFEQLSDEQASRISQVLSAGYLDGWEPSRDEVSDLADRELGRIDSAEFRARALARATDGR